MLVSCLTTMAELGRETGKPVHHILNRIGDRKTEKSILSSIDRKKLTATMPERRKISISSLAGRESDMTVKGIK